MLDKNMKIRKKKKERRRRLLTASVCLITVISLLFGTAPWNTGFIVRAAVAPTLSITSGTPYFYSKSGSNPSSVAYGTATSTTSVMSASMSGNVVTIKENSASKLFELGYVPITASLAIPANTTYQVTLTFTASGKKSASGGSAVAFVEIYDFGSANYSSSLTFNMSNNSTYSNASYTKLRAKESSKNKSFGGTYTVTVEFANTSASDKTISHYFGFFTGVHYGSSYSHTLTSTCTVTAGKIVDLDDITPTINVSSSDSGSIGWDKAANTFSKDNFVPDKDWNSLTKEEQETAMRMSNNMLGHPYVDLIWNGQRLTMSVPSNAGLTFSLKNGGTGGIQGRLAYVPFSVPLSVPAKTTRTYYLTFVIDYERNTGSGAGFFAELIQGGVPDTFNTAASATMTGSTKLRVYSSSGDAHSGSVQIPVTLTNDTGSTKIFTESFVFFAGWRPVGAYNPDPVFHLNLTDISYASYESDYGVVVNAQNCTYSAPAKVGTGEICTASFTANTGYTLPSAVTVKIGSSTLSTAYYTYNSSTGTLTIPAKYITDVVTVTVSGVPNKYAITYSGLEGASLTTKPTVHTYGTVTAVGNPTKTGYVFSGWKINGGATTYTNLTLGTTAYTGSITLTATWTNAKYNATLSGTNVSASSGFGTETVTYTTAWTGIITANSGYVLPDSISVTVGGSTLDSSKYTYTKSTGTVKIMAAYVTGNIAVTVNGHKHSYTGAVTTPAACTATGVRTYTCSCGDSYTETIPATGHKYGSPTWSWTGNTSAKAAFTCQNDSSHTDTVTASITSVVTTEATCTNNGVRTYTASVTFNGVNYTDTKTGVIPATRHNWASEWSSNSEQHWHVCTNEGCTVTDTKTAHAFDWVIDREPTVSTVGLKHEECTFCGYAKAAMEYTVDIISVEISWGAMEFTYSEGTWNAGNHTYEGSGWIPDETDSNAITVTNTGNVEVSVSYSYTQTNTVVTGSFTDGEHPVTAPIALPAGIKKHVWLILSEKPNVSLDKDVLGTVTVTIGGE